MMLYEADSDNLLPGKLLAAVLGGTLLITLGSPLVCYLAFWPYKSVSV
jgi:hypothetical protein